MDLVFDLKEPGMWSRIQDVSAAGVSGDLTFSLPQHKYRTPGDSASSSEKAKQKWRANDTVVMSRQANECSILAYKLVREVHGSNGGIGGTP